MNKAFEKIMERLENAIKECKELQRNTDDAYGYMKMKKGLVLCKGNSAGSSRRIQGRLDSMQ